jgi:hypothetical protein
MMTATLLSDNLEGWAGHAALYRVDPPMLDHNGHPHEYVIVSAVVAITGPETFIFPSFENGKTESMLEMGGSYRGGLSHSAALEGAGYTIK